MFNKQTLKDLKAAHKKVLLRVDFNVPLQDGEVTDDTRIRAALPTIQYLLDQKAAVIICSHLGRPKGSVNLAYSLKPAAERLAIIVNAPVHFASDCVGPVAEEAAARLAPGEVLVLENTRFYPGEEKNDPQLAAQLAALADVYVNDAFGSAHRAHASTVGVAQLLPAAAGLLMEKEIQYLGQAIANPKRPFVAILGGAKVSDKIDVIRNLLQKADAVLIGGGMANTFFKAQGFEMAESLVELDALETAKELLQQASGKLHLPVDVIVADAFSNEAKRRTLPVSDLENPWRILDIGPASLTKFGEKVNLAGTVVWNGPMGVFEFENFSTGTFGLAKIVAACGGVTIIGGGDSVAAINQAGLAEKITHISTGGGASLEMLAGKELPGVAVLKDR